MSVDRVLSPMPEPLIDHARNFDGNAAEPRDAATVALLRQHQGHTQTYMLRRASSMVFASGFSVFPGGKVDPQDRDPAIVLSPEIGAMAQAFAVEISDIAPIVVAAVRETFEETGVLLVDPQQSSGVGTFQSREHEFEMERVRLVSGESTFSEILRRQELVIQPRYLVPWGRWITPDFEPRRYDTRFFVARIPHGQRVRHVSSEAESSAWFNIDDLVQTPSVDGTQLLPPTLTTCREVKEIPFGDIFASDLNRIPLSKTGRSIEIDGELFIEHLVQS